MMVLCQSRMPIRRLPITVVRRFGFSLLEMLAVVSIMGVLAVIVLPRFSTHAVDVKKAACHTIKGNLEVQAQLWFRGHNSWPSSGMSDMAADPSYLPDGLPRCPVDGSAYVFDTSRERITGHTH